MISRFQNAAVSALSPGTAGHYRATGHPPKPRTNPTMKPTHWIPGALVAAMLPAAYAASQASFTFSPGNLENWTRTAVPGGTGNDYSFFATNATFGNRITWNDPVGIAGGLAVTDAIGTFDARGSTHNTAVLSSPTFTLKGLNAAAGINNFFPTEISFKLLAGGGNVAGPLNLSSLPAVSVDNGAAGTNAYLGVGLRRVSDGTYLLWGRRTTNAQNNNWQTVLWNETTLAAACAADAPGTLYTLDFIDGGHGNWGWIAMDGVTMVNQNSIMYVSVNPQDAVGADAGTDHQLSVRFTRQGDTSQAVSVHYSVAGTAIEGVDYQTLPGAEDPERSIIIPAGQSFVDLPIQVIPNDYPELDRSIQISVLGNENYLVGDRMNAPLWISDLPQSGMATASGPLPTATYIPFPNPLQAGTPGSLFFYGEADYSIGYVTIGIRPKPAENSANGGVDLGRNNASAGNALFDYLDNKAAASATARVAGTPEIPIVAGRYTFIGEIRMDSASSGTLRGWIWDGQAGSLAFATPNVATTFSSGFTGMDEWLYLRLDGSGATTRWTNSRAVWVGGSEPQDLQDAFAELVPSRPFVYVDPVGTAGEFGNKNAVFKVFRSGPPGAQQLDVPLTSGGTAVAADFTAALPVSASIAAGESVGWLNLEVKPDELYEGEETLSLSLEDSFTWLRGGSNPAMSILDRPFQDWMARNLPFGSADGPEDDTDGDGWSNLLEYFAGSSLSDGTSRGSAILAPGTRDTLRFSRNGLASDLESEVVWSTDLQTWKSSGESDGSRTVTINEQIVDAPEGLPQTVEAQAQVTEGSTDRIFLRLAVDLP